MNTLILLVLGFSFAIVVKGQEQFLVTDASKKFNIRIVVSNCDGWACGGAATYDLFSKGSQKSLQTFRLAETKFFIGETQETRNITREAVYFDDFNFDGKEDVAICDGNHASYYFLSYRIFLSSNGRFVYNSYFSRLTHENLGMFQIDKKKKELETFNKSGCCYHITERYAVVHDRPQRVFQLIRDASRPNGDKMEKTTTRKLIQGKWRTWVKYK